MRVLITIWIVVMVLAACGGGERDTKTSLLEPTRMAKSTSTSTPESTGALDEFTLPTPQAKNFTQYPELSGNTSCAEPGGGMTAHTTTYLPEPITFIYKDEQVQVVMFKLIACVYPDAQMDQATVDQLESLIAFNLSVNSHLPLEKAVEMMEKLSRDFFDSLGYLSGGELLHFPDGRQVGIIVGMQTVLPDTI